VRSPFADGAAAEAQFAGGVNYLPAELPTEPNSQIFADGPKFLPTELPRSQICRRSNMIADRAAGSKYLPTELPQKPNWPTEPIICLHSQIFSDGAKYLPTELPRSQICRRSKMIADRAAGAKYLPMEKPNLPTEPHLCRRSYRKSKFADGASYLPTAPHICRRSYRESQICRRSHIFANGAAGAKYLPTIICRQSRRSQVFADRAAPGAKFVVGASGAKFAIIACCMFYCLSIF
jgi:hypothetical protein